MRLYRYGKAGGWRADEDRYRMLVLGGGDCEVCGRGLDVLQRVLRLDYGDLIANSSLVLGAGVIERLLIGGNGVLENLPEGVLPAKLEKENREAGLLGEALVFPVRRTGLRLVLLFSAGI